MRRLHGRMGQHVARISRQDMSTLARWQQNSMMTIVAMPQRSFSTDVPKKEHGFRPQIHRLLYSSNTTLEEVFTMLASRVAPYDSKGSDAFFYKCLQHDSLSPSFFHDVVSYFDRFLHDDLVGPSDGAMASVVALLIKHGHLDHAESSLRVRLDRFPNLPPHFRVHAPFMEHYIAVGALELAWKCWESIKSSSTMHLPPDTVGPILASFALAALQHNDEHLLRKIMQDLHALRYQFSPADASAWEAAWHPPSPTAQPHIAAPMGQWSLGRHAQQLPVCTQCREPLEKLTVRPAELAHLLEVVRAMCVAASSSRHTSKQQHHAAAEANKKLTALADFEAWLSRRHAQVAPGKMHYIVDGPNVAYLNQNFEGGAFRFDYVDKVITELEAQGHVVSVTMPSIYFNEKSLLSVKASTANRRQRKEGKVFHRTRTNADKAFLDKWEATDVAFKCRREVHVDEPSSLLTALWMQLGGPRRLVLAVRELVLGMPPPTAQCARRHQRHHARPYRRAHGPVSHFPRPYRPVA
ncbi:hypothetical protein, variant 1 [Aphanomyces astaci]|uniref:Uncharacterized protein n=1 Tax=Aphanomyces astaci TaxID=112090 RepID=W4FVR6_APHAT|nr:hypothetical protein, variant 1 [Aphanomyces astaci]ETV70914.1 hypothetical protein, variant 1 [Aphanomyces astaci]|eukprot:XP_009839579.1 hypothetical protein, variant 1 [Aphanomyces astaci]